MILNDAWSLVIWLFATFFWSVIRRLWTINAKSQSVTYIFYIKI